MPVYHLTWQSSERLSQLLHLFYSASISLYQICNDRNMDTFWGSPILMFVQPDKEGAVGQGGGAESRTERALTHSLPLSSNSSWLCAGRLSFPRSVIACPSYIFLRGHPLPCRCISRVIRFERQVKRTKSAKFDWLSSHLHLNADFYLCYLHRTCRCTASSLSGASSSIPPTRR